MSYLVLGMKLGEKATLTDRRAVGRWIELTILQAQASEAVVMVTCSPGMDVRNAAGQAKEFHRIAVEERLTIRTADGEVIGNVWPTVARGRWSRLAFEAPRFLAITRKFPPPMAMDAADEPPRASIPMEDHRRRHTA